MNINNIVNLLSTNKAVSTTILILFIPLIISGQNINNKESVVNNLKNIIRSNDEKTMYSAKVADMCYECIANKLYDFYISATPEEKKSFKADLTNSKVHSAISKECIASVLSRVSTINKSNSNKIEVFDEVSMKQAMLASMDTTKMKSMGVNVNAAIDCIYEKIKYVNPGEKEFADIKDPNGFYAKNVLLPCVTSAKKSVSNNVSSTIKKTEIGGVDGPIETSKIQTLSLDNQLQAIGIRLSEKNYYFIIDTGASWTIISDNEEREFLMEGLINKSSYLSSVNVTLADGRTIVARRFLLKNFTLGKYTISNTEICVVPNAPYLLLGKSFLNKFSQWSFDNKTQELLLKK